VRENIIELNNVTFFSDDYRILDDISLNIEKDTYTCIIGRSGAGKSTLLKIMAGILTPQNGTVKLFSRDINNLRTKENFDLRKKVGFVFQDAALISNISIKENLLLPLEYHRSELKREEMYRKIIKIMEKIELLDAVDLRPAQLSFGERKLVGIARALITEPQVLFLDDPLASIDATLSKKISLLIKEYNDLEDTTIVAVSSLKSLIYNNNDRIVLIDCKSVAMDSTIGKILKTKKNDRLKIINDFLL
jgi:phospholipid/cholesterol/gamma-HCH transport system ATP-binding protein